MDDAGMRRQVALFSAESVLCDGVNAIGECLNELRVERPRQRGACWLALTLWQQLELDTFWRPRLRPSREGTPWLKVLNTLVAYRLIDPGSQWRLHRHWFDRPGELKAGPERGPVSFCHPRTQHQIALGACAGRDADPAQRDAA